MTALVLLPGMDGTGTLLRDFTAALAPTTEYIVVSYPPERTAGYAEIEAKLSAECVNTGCYGLPISSAPSPARIGSGNDTAARSHTKRGAIIWISQFSSRWIV